MNVLVSAGWTVGTSSFLPGTGAAMGIATGSYANVLADSGTAYASPWTRVRLSSLSCMRRGRFGIYRQFRMRVYLSQPHEVIIPSLLSGEVL